MSSCAGSSVEANVVFGMYSGLALLMDVHRPDRANGRGVIFVGGSGWQSALGWDAVGLKDKEGQLRDWFPPLLRSGFTLFAINHRSSPRFGYPAPLEDVQRAIRFVRSHAAEYGIEADRIGGVGGSSGAHLLCLAALLGAPGRAGDPDPVEREDATLQCLVLREAPFDLAGMFSEGDAEGAGYVLAFMGKQPSASPSESEIYAAASPITHVSRNAPPILLIHGDADGTVPFGQSTAMAAAMRAAGAKARLIAIPGGVHAPDFGAEGKPRADWPDYPGEMVAWLDRHLGVGQRG